MAYQYEYIDGKRVEVHVAAAFKKVKADFDRECAPITLHISDGTRTRAEQLGLFLGKYVTAGNVRGRKVYDVRWYDGKWWYRVVGGGTVAAPPNSNHEEDGPNGPRSIDVHDSGKDYGVTRFGTPRNAVAQRLFAKYGFENEGNLFDEAWHKTYRGPIGGALTSSKPAPTTSKPAAKTPTYKDMLGWRWTGIQRMLKAEYGYTGKIDNDPGPLTLKALRRFLNAKGYSRRACGWLLAVKGIFTVNDCRSIQQWLKETDRYSGKVDAIPGDGTHAGWDKAEAENGRAFSWVK